jgi:uncharacterized protein
VLLQNEIEIGLPLEEAWTVLTDLARIAPCLPGATLDKHDGQRYEGSVKVKVGPIGAHFTGVAEFIERDHTAHRAIISAAGKDPRGQATANAEVRAQLEAVAADRTRVTIDTELDISGRMAQFGRGAIADVSHRLLGQFAANLAQDLGTPDRRIAEPAAVRSTPPTRRASSRPTSPPGQGDGSDLDVMSLIVPMIRERYGQAILGGLLGALLSWVLFGRRVRS